VRLAPLLNLHVGGKVVGTTAEHPFNVKGKGWTPAQELRAGDEIRLMGKGWTTVEGIADSGLITTVYNLEIEGDHTYFVGCVEWGFSVWAHNAYGSNSKPNSVTLNHTLKAGKTTDFGALHSEFQRHVDAWNQILHKEGMPGLKQRLEQWEQFGDQIEAVGRRYTRSLGSAGKGQVWPHYPDMATGGRPKSAVGTPADARLNAIIGGQADVLRKKLLDMPDDVTEIAFDLLIK